MLKSKKILVTAGPTYEYLDDIRFIGNRSSGKQGAEIAKCLQKLEADVTLVIGPVNLELAGLNKVIRVESAVQMNDAVIETGPFDIAICAAAVSDWRPKVKAKTKIKKSSTGKPQFLELVENPDILKNICIAENRPDLVIGFAAETNDLLTNARSKLKNKGCDWIVANDVSKKNIGFGSDYNEVTIHYKNNPNKKEKLSLKRKSEISEEIVDRIVNQIN